MESNLTELGKLQRDLQDLKDEKSLTKDQLSNLGKNFKKLLSEYPPFRVSETWDPLAANWVFSPAEASTERGSMPSLNLPGMNRSPGEETLSEKNHVWYASGSPNDQFVVHHSLDSGNGRQSMKNNPFFNLQDHLMRKVLEQVDITLAKQLDAFSAQLDKKVLRLLIQANTFFSSCFRRRGHFGVIISSEYAGRRC